MKCPNCGNEIPDGKLYCENCGHEIHIVPEFDSVQEKISENMTEITEAIKRQEQIDAAKQKVLEEKEARHRHLIHILIALLVTSVSVGALIIFFLYSRINSKSYYVGEAYKASAAGDYDKSVEMINKALAISEKNGDKDIDLVIQKADYQNRGGRIDAAITTLTPYLNDTALSDDDEVSVYGKVVDIYTSAGNYLEIATLLDKCSNQKVTDSFRDYMISDPVFDIPSGDYDDIVYISINSSCNGSIFYTTDGTTPTTSSHLYNKPIELTDGEFSVSAIAVNRYGVSSGVTSGQYIVGVSIPDAPEVTTESGSYTSPTLIYVEEPEKGEVYYTTDGTDPTTDSEMYTAPISMPVGSSTYRFAVITDDEVSSEIVTYTYNYSPSSSLSKNDGPNYIIVALIRNGELAATDGTITGSTSKYSYSYVKTNQIGSYGNFYIYSETITDINGNSASTGRSFAVNLTNFTVNIFDERNGTLSQLG